MDISLSASLGIERNRSGEKYVIESLPIPAEALLEDSNEISKWAKLHDEIVATEKRERTDMQDKSTPLFNPGRGTSSPSLDTLLKHMNKKVYKLLGISKKQQWLIEDMLEVRMKLNDGVFDAEEAIDSATEKEIGDFARIFQGELDLFLDHSGKKKVHKVKVLYAKNSAVIIVDHLTRSTPSKPEVIEVKDNEIRQELNTLQENLTEKRSQWMYFTRCLQIHQDRAIVFSNRSLLPMLLLRLSRIHNLAREADQKRFGLFL